jgi:hypothetical protein
VGVGWGWGGGVGVGVGGGGLGGLGAAGLRSVEGAAAEGKQPGCGGPSRPARVSQRPAPNIPPPPAWPPRSSGWASTYAPCTPRPSRPSGCGGRRGRDLAARLGLAGGGGGWRPRLAAAGRAASAAGAPAASNPRPFTPHPNPPQPPPPRRSFYDGAAKIGMMEAFKKLAVGPDELPDIIFASVGRTIWKDVGGVALGFRCGGWGGGRRAASARLWSARVSALSACLGTGVPSTDPPLPSTPLHPTPSRQAA